MSAAIKAAKGGGRASVSGDPGLFGGFLGGIRGATNSFLSGGNPFAGAITGARAGFKGAPTTVSNVPPPISVALGRTPQVRPPGPGIALPAINLPGGIRDLFRPGRGGGGGGGGGGAVAMGTDLVPFIPKGFHPNKSDYFLRDGTFVAKGTKFVKNRHRNPLNPRALRRAIGRIDAGKIWQGKLHEISTAKFTAAGNRKD